MLEEHLGGHNGLTHLDEGALNWAIENLKIKSLLDVGCGPGGMVELANNIGIDAEGIDGDHTIERYDTSKFIIHDFTHGPAPLTSSYDIGWSCEFVEHVYEQYIPNYIQAFQKCKVLAMTYAPPGWTGHHHVNLQEEQYWIDKLAEYNLIYNNELTIQLRKHSTMNEHKKKKAFVKNRGLIFINNEL